MWRKPFGRLMACFRLRIFYYTKIRNLRNTGQQLGTIGVRREANHPAYYEKLPLRAFGPFATCHDRIVGDAGGLFQ